MQSVSFTPALNLVLIRPLACRRHIPRAEVWTLAVTLEGVGFRNRHVPFTLHEGVVGLADQRLTNINVVSNLHRKSAETEVSPYCMVPNLSPQKLPRLA